MTCFRHLCKFGNPGQKSDMFSHHVNMEPGDSYQQTNFQLSGLGLSLLTKFRSCGLKQVTVSTTSMVAILDSSSDIHKKYKIRAKQ